MDGSDRVTICHHLKEAQCLSPCCFRINTSVGGVFLAGCHYLSCYQQIVDRPFICFLAFFNPCLQGYLEAAFINT